MDFDVLLVDDNAVQGATRQAILERSGCSVVIALNGLQALNLLDAPDGPSVRMIITDHLMPGMNGVEFVRTLRRQGYSIPVLVLSGYAEVEEEYASLDVAFRVKPFPPEHLVAFVQYVLRACERRTA